MRRMLLLLAASTLIALAAPSVGSGAELSESSAPRPYRTTGSAAKCPLVRQCNESVCVLRRLCPVSDCPPGYPCHSLYGAYGPYGGSRYWGAYTSTGWGSPNY